MRYLWAVSYVLVLSGCVILPIPGERTDGFWELRTDKLDALLGKPENDLRETFSFQKPAVFSENGRRHLLYVQSREHGYLLGPVKGMHGFLWEQYRCFRFTFSEDDKLQAFNNGIFYSDPNSPTIDCIHVFWTQEELVSIRRSQENFAAAGDQEAAWIMAEEYGDTGPLSELALSTKDIAVARILAVEYNNHGPLTELAARDTKTEKELGLLSRARKPQLTSLAGLSNDEINRLAEEGDPEAQFQRYLSNADPDSLAWLCRAADKGHPSAQYRIGELYWTGAAELEKSVLLSYKWHRLSAVKGTHSSMLALVYVEAAMSPAQLSKAQQLYIDWLPGQCEIEIEQNRIRN